MRIAAAAITVCVGLAAGLRAPAVMAQTGPAQYRLYDIDWLIDGTNTLRYEHYGVAGDPAGSPFQHEGPQPYNETYVHFSGDVSPYERVHGSLGALLNESEYRSPDDYLTVERANLTWEKGDARVPARMELGDYFGFVSPRTIQRPLKGAQVDLQPAGLVPGGINSLQLMSGFTAPTWRNIDPGRDHYTGASWLAEHPRFGSWSVNAVNNRREADPTFPRDSAEQTVISIAGERRFALGGDDITIEGEVARMIGDIDQGAASRFDQTGRGHFFQLRGRSPDALTYSARYEIYDDDFRPNGAAVFANRRTLEARAGYRFADPALRLDGRLQQFTDNLQHATSLRTRVAGASLSGAVPARLLSNATFRLDSFVQDSETRDEATDNFTHSTQLDITAPLDPLWLGRLAVGVIGTDNRTASDTDTTTRQVAFGASRPIALLGLAGAFNADLLLRRVSGSSATWDFGPSVGATLAGGPHAFSASLSTLAIHPNPGTNVDTRNAALSYSYSTGAHTFGSELAFVDRDPTGLASTNSYRVGVFWRVQLGSVFAQAAPIAPEPPLPAGESGGIQSLDRLRLTAIPPGLPLADAERRLAGYGLVAPARLPGALVYEAQLVPTIDQRQRLAVVHAGGRVTRSALIIDLGAAGDVASAGEIFARAQEAMLRRYGQPSQSFELGQFSPALESDINNSTFIRTTEWRTTSGTLRLGIPRRLDRIVRIELQLAPSFAPPRDTLWSIQTIR